MGRATIIFVILVTWYNHKNVRGARMVSIGNSDLAKVQLTHPFGHLDGIQCAGRGAAPVRPLGHPGQSNGLKRGHCNMHRVK